MHSGWKFIIAAPARPAAVLIDEIRQREHEGSPPLRMSLACMNSIVC